MLPIIALKLFLLGLSLPSVRLENRTETRKNVTKSEKSESNKTEDRTEGPPLPTEERENVTDILLIDLPAGSDYGFGEEDGGKEVLIKTKNSETKGVVHKKNSLFSKDLEVEECEKGECKKSAIDSKFKKKLEDCTYTGKLVDDPDSTLSVTNCAGVMQMTYMSSKANLSSNSFRKENGKTYQNEGIIRRDQKISQKGVEETLAEETARKVKNGDAYLTPDGETVELEEMDSRDYSDDKCCRVKKKICKKDKVTKKTNLLSCRTSYSDTKCGVDCEKYKERIQKNSKKNIENIMKKNQTATEETKSSAGKDETTTSKSETSKEETPEESTTEASNNEETTESNADKDKKDKKDVIKDSFYNELFGDDDEDEKKDGDDKEEDAYEKEENKKKTTGGSGDKDEKSKDLRDLVTDELVKINEDAETSKKRDAPKSNSMFRSKAVKLICAGGCAEKADNPTEKIYDERTIELGIFVDKYLWNDMKEQVKGGEDDVKLAMLDMIHSLVVSTETLYQHPTVSAKGGFKLAINGIVIWKDDNDPLVKAIHDAGDQLEQLDAFQEYAKNNNELV
ncbi:glutamic acid-rich protein [Eurytemora carolleeae]|uniref:glutamic acid-rich protein n=1 Tax=Eurytemora carolleeae TaxID=1294199 RepID=UPI000C76F133|nr:glutamic acid-rich protein [Eurytemora carolleeae]|eukprot:XP_023329129.1 glutamic acid-rich protein-like [Eurytemora affinis]